MISYVHTNSLFSLSDIFYGLLIDSELLIILNFRKTKRDEIEFLT